MQADLLRVLQHGEFKRVGGNTLIKVNVRIVAATNRNLQEAIKNGRFRQDLFFRLDVLTVEMPRLSERREDIPLLAAHFMKNYGQIRTEPFPPVMGISPGALHLLVSYSWPGNVRELENAIERGIALGVTPDIRPDDLPKALRPENLNRPATIHTTTSSRNSKNRFSRKDCSLTTAITQRRLEVSTFIQNISAAGAAHSM